MAKQHPTKRKVASTPRSASSRRLASDATPQRQAPRTDVLKLMMNVIVIVLALAVLIAGALLVLRNTSAFEISKMEVASTEHLSSDDIARLANVGQGTTLLNLDESAIRSGLARNPWVGSVDIDREFPDTLRLTVHERKVTMIVLMGASNIGWYVGEGNVWIQPVSIDAAGGRSVAEEALLMSQDLGALLVTDLPSTLEPESGTPVNDPAIAAVSTYLEDLPQELTSQIVSFSAPSVDALSCVLSSGIEVSLGSVSDIGTKGSIVLRLIEEHPGELTYINVRTPANPSYRSISSNTVQPGTGTAGDALDNPVGVGAETVDTTNNLVVTETETPDTL